MNRYGCWNYWTSLSLISLTSGMAIRQSSYPQGCGLELINYHYFSTCVCVTCTCLVLHVHGFTCECVCTGGPRWMFSTLSLGQGLSVKPRVFQNDLLSQLMLGACLRTSALQADYHTQPALQRSPGSESGSSHLHSKCLDHWAIPAAPCCGVFKLPSE